MAGNARDRRRGRHRRPHRERARATGRLQLVHARADVMEAGQAAGRRADVRRQRRSRLHDGRPEASRGRHLRQPELAGGVSPPGRECDGHRDAKRRLPRLARPSHLARRRPDPALRRHELDRAEEAAKRPGRVSYLDTYFFFAGDDGGYAQYIEDSTGKLVKMRADDGVHFERAAGDLSRRRSSTASKSATTSRPGVAAPSGSLRAAER